MKGGDVYTNTKLLTDSFDERRKTMSLSRIFSMMMALILVVGIGTIDCTVAGETVKLKAKIQGPAENQLPLSTYMSVGVHCQPQSI